MVDNSLHYNRIIALTVTIIRSTLSGTQKAVSRPIDLTVATKPDNQAAAYISDISINHTTKEMEELLWYSSEEDA